MRARGLTLHLGPPRTEGLVALHCTARPTAGVLSANGRMRTRGVRLSGDWAVCRLVKASRTAFYGDYADVPCVDAQWQKFVWG